MYVRVFVRKMSMLSPCEISLQWIFENYRSGCDVIFTEIVCKTSQNSGIYQNSATSSMQTPLRLEVGNTVPFPK